MNIYSKVEVQYTIVQMTREADDLFRKGMLPKYIGDTLNLYNWGYIKYIYHCHKKFVESYHLNFINYKFIYKMKLFCFI